MKKNSAVLDIIIIIVLYFVISIACSFLIVGISVADYFISNGQSIGGHSYQEIMQNIMTPDILGWSLCIADIIAVILLMLLKKVNLKTGFSWNNCKAKYIPYVIFSCIISIFALDLISEIIDLPNMVEVEMTGMAHSAIGILAIAIIGPICEEIMFREGICGTLLRSGAKPWTAILVSAVIFGIIHINPAQVPFAFAVGVILAILYYKTKSLIPSTVIHILNNSYAVWMMIKYEGQEDVTFKELLGNNPYWPLLIGCTIIGFALFYNYWKKR